jgi:hypothetical protein
MVEIANINTTILSTYRNYQITLANAIDVNATPSMPSVV